MFGLCDHGLILEIFQPKSNFFQVGKCSTADIISASVGSSRAPALVENAASSTAGNHSDPVISVSCDPILCITQLEQNIKFLKEQHHLMLTSLHHEVETLRQRNRGERQHNENLKFYLYDTVLITAVYFLTQWSIKLYLQICSFSWYLARALLLY